MITPNSIHSSKTLPAIDLIYRSFTGQEPVQVAVAATFSLIYPNFTIIEGNVFNPESGAIRKIPGLKAQGLGVDEIAFWANMFDIRDILSELEYEDAVNVAHYIVVNWNKLLESNFPTTHAGARVYEEYEEDEIWITICRKSVDFKQ